MSSVYFDRKYEVQLNDQPIITDDSLRINFQVTQDYGGFVSYADMKIYNISQTTIGKFKIGVPVSLKAGYENNIDFIFKGPIINTVKGRNGPTTFIQIIARGGGLPDKTISQTLGVGTPITTIIRALSNSLGFPTVINEGDFANDRPLQRGATLDGDPRQILDEYAKQYNFSYVINNDKIRITKNDKFIPGSIQEVSQFTGMIGIPEITENGCDTTITMNPKVKIGGRIEIKSELKTFNFSNVYYRKIPPNAGSGVYRVFKVIHSGDNRAGGWETQITGFR